MMGKSWKTIEPEGDGVSFWAAYSDIMAGVLLVFAIVAISARHDFEQSVKEPQELLKEWEKLEKVCEDFKAEGIRAECSNGTLILSDENLSYDFNNDELGDAGRQILRKVVPIYLAAVRKHADFEKVKGLEISGHSDSPAKVHENNLDVSAARAQKVLTELLEMDELDWRQKALLLEKGYVTGYADTRPPNGEERRDTEWAEARRIEIEVHLDDAALLRKLKRFLDEFSKRNGSMEGG